jgi:hypothetical protein
MGRADGHGLDTGFGDHGGGIFEGKRAILGGEGAGAAALRVAYGHQLRLSDTGQGAGMQVPYLAASDDSGPNRARFWKRGRFHVGLWRTEQGVFQ